jgi:CheY-like chemotaxis protein
MSDVQQNVARAPTIVLVDDESSIRNALSSLLQDQAYVVHCAQNGKEALRLVKSVLPDLVITDFMMPEMSGMELALVTKTDATIAHIPIILMTGAHLKEDMARHALFSCVLEKPLSAPLLMEAIFRLVGK